LQEKNGVEPQKENLFAAVPICPVAWRFGIVKMNSIDE
jgi:hypothetical protein